MRYFILFINIIIILFLLLFVGIKALHSHWNQSFRISKFNQQNFRNQIKHTLVWYLDRKLFSGISSFALPQVPVFHLLCRRSWQKVLWGLDRSFFIWISTSNKVCVYQPMIIFLKKNCTTKVFYLSISV